MKRPFNPEENFSQKADALLQVVSSGNLEKVKQLLQSSTIREIAHANENAPLRCAAAKGYTDIVNLLLTLPAVRQTAHALENQVFRDADHNGHAEIAKRLLEISAASNNAHSAKKERP